MLGVMVATAASVLRELEQLASDQQRARYERFFPLGSRRPGDEFLGVPMGQVFALAGRMIELPLDHVESLLESEVHEARATAVKILALRAQAKSVTPEEREQLVSLYLRRHDRIDAWDLVDLGAPYLLGPHLRDRDRGLLDELAASPSPWERRSALYATVAFLRAGDSDDAARIAERLIDDPHESVQKAVGTILRGVGDVDLPRLRAILDRHAGTMPRVALRMAIEKLGPDERADYRALRGR